MKHLKPNISAIIREMSIEPEEQCEKIAEEIVNFLESGLGEKKIVWPERKTEQFSEHDWCKMGWNACLDEFARLNPWMKG